MESENRSKLICTNFRVAFTKDGASCIYANVYSLSAGEHEFWAFGPSLSSHDGEYRERFCEWKKFDAVHERWPDALDAAEEMVVGLLSSGEVTLHADMFYPPSVSQEARSAFETALMENSRLPVRLLAVCFAVDGRRLAAGTLPGHSNATYLAVITGQQDAAVVPDDGLANFGLEKGQKIYPTDLEGIIGDINLRVWRDLYAGKLAHDLVVSKLADGFPAQGEWFFICNAHEDLFDNKYCRRKAGKGVAVLAVSEWLGNTVANSKEVIENLSAELQERLLFEFLYGFYRLGATAGVIHGDPHLNNVTVAARKGRERFELNGESTGESTGEGAGAFTFPQSPLTACIIDFSRAILDPKKVAIDFGEEYTKEFVRLQNIRIKKTLKIFYPKSDTDVNMDYPGLFKALTCIDVQIFASNMYAYFDIAVAGAVAKRAKALLVEIFKTEPEEFEWPVKTILNEFFHGRFTAVVGGREEAAARAPEDESWMFE